MKKLILMLILLVGVSFAQTTDSGIRGRDLGFATVYTDSIGYGTAGTAADDSVLIIGTQSAHSWYRVFVEGNANSPVDSFVVQAGIVRHGGYQGAIQDTIWGSWMAVKDSVWGTINTMINNSVGKDFLLFTPMAHILKFTLLNHRGGLATRNCVITVQALRK